MEDNTTVTCDIDEVVGRWGRDFESLFIPPQRTDQEQAHVEFIKQQNKKREEALRYMPDQYYNATITQNEVRKAIFKSKNNKAPDSLTYEVLKNDTTVLALSKLFNLCFDRGLIPTTWFRG